MLAACNNLTTATISDESYDADDRVPSYVEDFGEILEQPHHNLENVNLVGGDIDLRSGEALLSWMAGPNGSTGIKRITVRTEELMMDDTIGDFIFALNQTLVSVDFSIEVTEAASVDPEDFLEELRDSQSLLLALVQSPASVSFET